MAGTKETAHALSRKFGQRLKAVRLMRGYSQEKLAGLIGLSFQQVQKYESGANRISIPALMEICEVLEAHPMDILGEVPHEDGAERPNVLLQRLELAESKLKIAESKLARVQKIISSREPFPD
jgi:transcriptional regulator with XRE-family HTH domain